MICYEEKKALEATQKALTKYSQLPIKAGLFPDFDPTVTHPEEVYVD